MKCLVTGAAGFIGSHLAERLVQEGFEVVGVDAFTDAYDPAVKEQNVRQLLQSPQFRLIRGDLLALDLDQLLEGVEVVYHQAAQAGVRSSWGGEFHHYVARNVAATQRLLEACKDRSLRKFVYASSSSVYGESEVYPTPEEALPRPVSPYGVTKLAAEHLCVLYWKNYEIPTVSLRYFTVYGPRQRPDMAFHRFIVAIHRGEPISLYGDGEQSRDFTYISDVVEANLLAAEKGRPGEVYNIGGGARATLKEVLGLLEEITGERPQVQRREVQRGDVRHTRAELSKSRAELGYAPKVPLIEGLKRQVEWILGRFTP
jgi:UDP-glucose 4-epimerase